MFRSLAIVAGVSVVIAAAAFAGAFALGGRDLTQRGSWEIVAPWDGADHRAGGPSRQQTRDLTGFDRVTVAGGLSAEITAGQGFKVEVEGADPATVVTELDGSELSIRPRRNGWWGRSAHALVKVSLPAAREVSSAAGAQVRLAGVAGGDLALEASSGAELIASGACGALDAQASSGASLDAAALTCAKGEADASSGAHAGVSVTGPLDVTASSGGTVFAGGDPQIGQVSLSSGGRLERP